MTPAPLRTRGQHFRNATPQQLDAYARSQGFPSFAAFEFVTSLGARLSEGHRITKADATKVSTFYPAIPPDVIHSYAARINSAPTPAARADALVARVISSDPAAIAAGREVIQEYATAQTVSALSQRLDGSADTASILNDTAFRAGWTKKDIAKAAQAEAVADQAAKADTASLRATLARQLAHIPADRRELVQGMPTSADRRLLLADVVDDAAERLYESAHRPTEQGSGTLHDGLAAAWDLHDAAEQGDAELSSEDIVPFTE